MVINSLAVALNTRYHFRDKAVEPASTPQCTSQSPNDLTSFTELKFKGKDESRKLSDFSRSSNKNFVLGKLITAIVNRQGH